MTNKPEKKFYWTEGVGRKEVESALTANKYPALYQQPTRRMLVVLYCTLLMVCVGSLLIDDNKIQTYVQGLSLIALFVLYLVLRRAVRMIADAPSELLDERFVAIRDRTYLIAYRWLMGMIGFFFGYTLMSAHLVDRETLLSVIVFFAMYGAGLPSMILAWTLPSED